MSWQKVIPIELLRTFLQIIFAVTFSLFLSQIRRYFRWKEFDDAVFSLPKEKRAA